MIPYSLMSYLAGFPLASRGMTMAREERVITAIPEDLASKMDEIAARMERSKSWIVRQAVAEWVAEEQRRCELTLEALKSVDEGRTLTHEEVLARGEQRKKERRARG